MKTIKWREHAKYKFLTRVALHGLYEGDIEHEVLKQDVKIDEGFSDNYPGQKFKTIFPISNFMFTVEKAETKHEITIITLWESKQKEIEIWKRMKRA